MSDRQRRGISFFISGVMLCSLMVNPVYAGEYVDSAAVGTVAETVHTHETQDAAAVSAELAAQDVEQADGAIVAADEENEADILLENAVEVPEEELQAIAADEEELIVTGIEVLSDGLPEGSDAPADGDVADGDETVPDADAPQGDMGVRDTSVPVITVKTAENGHSIINGYYCELPEVTVTDAGNNLATLEITVKVGQNDPITESITISGSSYTVLWDELKEIPKDTEGIFGIVATDSEGNKAGESVVFRVQHILGGRYTRTVEATCDSPRLEITDYICKSCGESYYTAPGKKVGDPLGHIKGDVVAETNFCGEEKPTLYTCTRCGAYVTEEGTRYDPSEIVSHEWETEKTVEKSGCTTPGMEYYKCEKCGARKDVKVIPATGHALGFFKTVREPSDCEAKDGLRERRCTNDGCELVQQEYFGNNSKHKAGTPEVTAATCTTEGKTVVKCTVCKKVLSETTIPALGHSYSQTQDCTQPAMCDRCHQEVPGQSEHTWSKTYEHDGTSHWQKCTTPGCTVTTGKEAHHRGTQQKLCTDKWTCSVCGLSVDGQPSHNLTSMENDENFHWYVCANEGCEYKEEKIPHKLSGAQDDCTKEIKCTECGYVARQAQASHSKSETWSYDSSGHWRTCTNPNCSVKLDRSWTHDYQRQGDNCGDKIICTTCGYEPQTRLNHNYYGSPLYSDEEGHYKKCQNGKCNQIDRRGSHEGGEATCTQLAVCTICGQSYGKLDENNHPAGHTRLEGYKAPTATEKGYSGDVVCISCEKVLEKGTELDPIPCEHVWGEQQFDDAGSWYECTKCHAKDKMTPHTFEPGAYVVTEEGHCQKCIYCEFTQTTVLAHVPEQEDYDCTTPLKCSVCGYEMEKASAGHSFGTEFSSHSAGHWHVCTNENCGQTDGLAEHVEEGDRTDCTKDIVCKDCGFLIREGMEEHDWDAAWTADDNGHYQKCLNEDCRQTNHKEHEPLQDDEDCQTPVVCQVCNAVIQPGMTHDFSGEYHWDENGHWQLCQNKGCTQNSGEKMHVSDDSTKATCQNPATCTVCGQAFGKPDPNIHQHTELRNYVEPTEKQEGYSGDLCCVDCNAVLSKGEKLDKLPETHEHVFDVEMSDDTHHWKECRCGDRKEYEPHNLGDMRSDSTHHWRACTTCGHVVRGEHVYKDGKCTVCDYAQNIHEHEYSWKFEGDTHWQECDICGEQVNNGLHKQETGSDEETHWAECSACGYKGEKEAHSGEDDGDCSTAVVCDICGRVLKEAEEQHNWSDSYTFDGGKHWFPCQNKGCTQKKAEAAHGWDGGAVTKAATCTQAGVRTYTCTTCSAKRTETLPATGHKWSEWTLSASQTAQTRSCSACHATESRGVELTADSLKMKTGQSTTKFKVTDMAPGDSILSVKSSNKKLLKVSKINKKKGTFKLKAGKKKGTVKLIVTMESGLKKTIRIKVQGSKVKTTKVKVTGSLTLKKGKKTTLKPVVTPVTSQDKVSYKSSNPAVASVSAKGVVRAKKKGTAKITVKAGSKKAVCTVTVR